MTMEGFQVGKLYEITMLDEDDSWSSTGMIVYRKPVGVGASLSLSWIVIRAGNFPVMWLGSKGCPADWARLLYKDVVYYTFLGHPHNLKRLQRVQ